MFLKEEIFKLILIFYILTTFVFSFFDNTPTPTPGDIWFYNGQVVEFRGVVIKEPDKRIDHVKLTVQALSLKDTRMQGRVLVSVNLYPDYHYGDEVLMKCKLKSPAAFNGFAYDRYLAKDKIYSQCSFAKIEILSSGNGYPVLSAIFNFKYKLQRTINSHLPEPQASLFSAIMLGSRRGIPQEILDHFSITGTAHLIAISGLHITILSSVLMRIFLSFWISRRKSFWLVTFFLIFYITMIGFPASAVRAGVMGFLFMLAQYVGRLNRVGNALLLAASVMIFFNPRLIRDDIGFQLSFSAVLGIAYLMPYFKNLFKNIPAYLGLKDIFLMSLSAQLSTAPLIIFYFGQLSMIGLLANLFILPLMPLLMIVGFVAILISLMVPFLTEHIFILVFMLLSFILKIINILAFLPYAAIDFY